MTWILRRTTSSLSINISISSFISFNTFNSTFKFISLHLSKMFLFNTFSSKKSSLIKNLCYSSFSFFSPFAKRTEGLTAWILLCLSSPLQKIQRINRLRILLILSFPLSKRFQRTNRLRYLLFPLTKIQRTNRLRILYPNTLECISFVIQVEGTSTWRLLYWEQERVHLLWISSSGGYIHLVIQREQGRVHSLWIFGL